VSQTNVELVQAALAAYFTNDEATLRELVAPDAIISPPPDQPEAGNYHGYDGFVRLTAEWMEAWEGHALEVQRIWEVEDFVFLTALQRAQGRSSGLSIDNPVAFAFSVQQGKIVRLWMFGTEDEALKAVALEE
jgi:ketosteroid isomerase-like protein